MVGRYKKKLASGGCTPEERAFMLQRLKIYKQSLTPKGQRTFNKDLAKLGTSLVKAVETAGAKTITEVNTHTSKVVNERADQSDKKHDATLAELKALRRNEPVDVDGHTTMLIARLQNNVRQSQSQARILKEVLLLEKQDGLSQADALKKVYETSEAEKATAKQLADDKAKEKKMINDKKKEVAKVKRDAKKAAEDKVAEPSGGQDAAEAKKRIDDKKKEVAKAKRDAKKASEDKAAEPSDGQDAAEEKPNGKQAAKKPSKKKAAGDTAAASEGSASASGPLAPFLKQRDVVA